MSNFLHGRIIINDNCSLVSKINSEMVEFSIRNNFALHYIDTLPSKNTVGDINFIISDNFFVKYCECFLEPIIYTLDGVPIVEHLCKDLNKLQELVNIIFKYDFVENVELRFSYVEVNEEDYEVCETNVGEMKNIILEKFLSESDSGFPVLNIVINRDPLVN